LILGFEKEGELMSCEAIDDIMMFA